MSVKVKSANQLKKGDRVLYNGVWLTVIDFQKSEALKNLYHVRFEGADIGVHLRGEFQIAVERA